MTTTSSLAERLRNPEAFLSRSDLRELGLERRAIDAIFRSCEVVYLPGYSRGLIKVHAYHRVISDSTFRDNHVRPTGRGPTK